MAGPRGGQAIRRLPFSIEELVANLARPRKVMLMVKAGPAVDEFIDKLIPLLSPGDVIIDGGNTHFADTERRTKYVEDKGLLYIGTGVSGGEEGALKGPSMMPGGSAGRLAAGQADLPGDRRQGRARTTTFRAASGSARAAPATTSRWCTTASSTATCS
jgi:hypothetical protein